MNINFAIFICFILAGLSFVKAISNKRFPKDFKFGTATAAYQVEGGWNADGKGENIWDRLCHTNPLAVVNKDNGDVSCDSYHRYKQDIEILKNLGVNYYRFSISWSRILPTGFTNKINQAGVQYYKNLIKGLKESNIEPMITLYHWDLPQPLQDIGGWPNPLLAEHFANYARVCFELFGDDVKIWITFNEPKEFCYTGYGLGRNAPMISSSGIGEYLCGHTVLKAHALAYHIYDKTFREKQKGKISIVFDTQWFEPGTNKTEDIEAAETRIQFHLGWYANPIFKGNYPQIMIDRIAERSKKEGFPKSRLPEFTKEEIDFIKGTHDFLGVNTYTTSFIKKILEAEYGEPSWLKDMGVFDYGDPAWESSGSSWLKIVPWGMRKLLVWIKQNYDNPEIIITENGVSDFGDKNDLIRIHYYTEYLSNILDAIYDDKVNVTGFTAWSLMDNFEWMRGYSEKFGLYHVSFKCPHKTRMPKISVNVFKKIIATHCLIDECIN